MELVQAGPASFPWSGDEHPGGIRNVRLRPEDGTVGAQREFALRGGCIVLYTRADDRHVIWQCRIGLGAERRTANAAVSPASSWTLVMGKGKDRALLAAKS